MDLNPFILEGEIVRLEPLTVGHADALVEVAKEAALWEFTVARVSSHDDMVRYIASALEDAQQGVALPFAIVEKQTGLSVGSTRYGNIDQHNRRVEIGWTWIGGRWQRTGINSEMKYLMLRHAFEVWNCVRVEFKTDALNLRSRKAITRLGAREEGILRRHMVTAGGRWRDTVYYSILQEEWPAVRDGLRCKMGLSGSPAG